MLFRTIQGRRLLAGTLFRACRLIAGQSNPLAQLEAQLPDAVDPGAIMMELAINHVAAGNRNAALDETPEYRRLLERVRRDNPPLPQSRAARPQGGRSWEHPAG